jgi:hypothetical protein
MHFWQVTQTQVATILVLVKVRNHIYVALPQLVPTEHSCVRTLTGYYHMIGADVTYALLPAESLNFSAFFDVSNSKPPKIAVMHLYQSPHDICGFKCMTTISDDSTFCTGI